MVRLEGGFVGRVSEGVRVGVGVGVGDDFMRRGLAGEGDGFVGRVPEGVGVADDFVGRGSGGVGDDFVGTVSEGVGGGFVRAVSEGVGDGDLGGRPKELRRLSLKARNELGLVGGAPGGLLAGSATAMLGMVAPGLPVGTPDGLLEGLSAMSVDLGV